MRLNSLLKSTVINGGITDNFELPHMILMGHNPPYYRDLIENAGLRKVRDLYAYHTEVSSPPKSLLEVSKKISSRSNMVFRSMNQRRFHEEINTVFEAQKKAWSRNWGEVPLTYAEFHNAAAEMKVFLDKDLIVIAEHQGEPVGIGALLPDFHQAQKHANGKLNPITAWRVYWKKRKIDRFRVFLLGTLPEFRRRGIETVILAELWQRAYQKGYKNCELSWVLDNNDKIIDLIHRFGVDKHKTYRLYECDLAETNCE